jgi:hypothetical protein
VTYDIPEQTGRLLRDAERSYYTGPLHGPRRTYPLQKRTQHYRHFRQQLIDTYGLKCALCEIELIPLFWTKQFGLDSISSTDPRYVDWQRRHLHIDHIIPVARGGSNDFENLRLLCAWCNMHKHASLT